MFRLIKKLFRRSQANVDPSILKNLDEAYQENIKPMNIAAMEIFANRIADKLKERGV